MPENETNHTRIDGGLPAAVAQRVRELFAEVADLKQPGAEMLTDTFAHWLTAHYVVAAKRAASSANADGIDLKTLRALSSDVVALRRGDHYAERLSIEREQLELNRAQLNEHMEKVFWEWANKPESKSLICDGGLSADEKAERIREIFGRNGRRKGRAPHPVISRETLHKIETELNLL